MKCYTAKEVAEICQVHPETIKREAARNKIKHFKVGSEIRFSEEHVNDYMNVRNYSKTIYEMELEKQVAVLTAELNKRELALNSISRELLKIQYNLAI